MEAEIRWWQKSRVAEIKGWQKSKGADGSSSNKGKSGRKDKINGAPDKNLS